MKETWKEIHDGFYEVSDLGRIRRAKPGISTFVGRIVSPNLGAGGYLQVQLNGSIKQRRYLHHLVAESFLGPRPDGHVVNHKDCNRQNNALENLEYLTYSQNSRHAFLRNGRPKGPTKPKVPLKGKQVGDKHWSRRNPHLIARGTKMPHCKLTPELVVSARVRVASGESQTLLAAELGISVAQMSRIIRRTRWTYV